jgi:hypothetical protein
MSSSEKKCKIRTIRKYNNILYFDDEYPGGVFKYKPPTYFDKSIFFMLKFLPNIAPFPDSFEHTQKLRNLDLSGVDGFVSMEDCVEIYLKYPLDCVEEDFEKINFVDRENKCSYGNCFCEIMKKLI